MTIPNGYDPITLNHWLWYKYQCHEGTASEFQRLFENIFKRAKPEFMQIRPYGKIGDRKCDRLFYSEDNSTVFQVYSPDELKQAKVQKKIDEDLDGAVAHWGDNLKKWVFVYNVRRGLPPDIPKTLKEKQKQYLDIKLDHFSSDRITTNNSDITAASSSQQGGNLTLTGERFIFQDSNLNASAANEGDGGNVTIDADTVLGINSDITATAEFGDGGNVTIDADGVLEFTEASAIKNNGVSEVDVTSEFGRSGTITITNPQNTNSDPIVLLVTALQRNNNLPLRTDCDNDAGNGEAYLTDNTHPNIPDSPETYLDTEDVVAEEPIVEEPLPPDNSVIEELLWKPGKPYAVADVQIQTPDGRIFGVNRKQLIKMQQRGCVDVEAIED